MILLNPNQSITKNAHKGLTSLSGTAVYVNDSPDAIDNDSPESQVAEVPNINTPEPIIQHPEFFFDNTLIAIRIENVLFNVHKYQLAKSDFFAEVFKISKPKGDRPAEGSSPEHPIVIQGARASDFAALLKVLYASLFSSSQPTPEASLIVPAFRLANLLSFSDLRAYLLPFAEKHLDDVDKIVFAREFDIKEWLAPAHIRLCKRDAVLSTEEANKLGVNSVLLIWRLREQHRGRSSTINPGNFYCPGCIGLSNGYGSSTCVNRKSTSTSWYCNGLGRMGATTNTNESALESDVEKWVEDGCIVKD